jgi:hypothetical protein
VLDGLTKRFRVHHASRKRDPRAKGARPSGTSEAARKIVT